MRQLGAVTLAAAVALAGCGGDDDDDRAVGTSTTPATATTTVADAPPQRFPDARPVAPAYSGPRFSLSQDYPARQPELGPTPWTAFDFRTQSEKYLDAVLDYAVEGNAEVDFRGQDNDVRRWYHAPWMHEAREFIHGLTRERPLGPRVLADTQTTRVQNWAVSLYNPRGGFVLGEVWRNADAPDPSKARFPTGAVAVKLIFTTATVQQVPWLARSLEWEADVETSAAAGPRPKLRLLQIDIAVRDPRADATTGWVFGTFVYNNALKGETVWDRMVPVGVMWGNDPARIRDGGPLAETVILNRDLYPFDLPLGRGGRLNGPIDNPASSCTSCHSTAQVAPDLSQTADGILPRPASPENVARYFRNIMAGTPFSPGNLALDYSLQLQNGIVARARAGGLQKPPGRDPDAVLDDSKGVEAEPVDR